MKRIFAALTLTYLLVTGSVFASTDWPNEPAGFSQVADCPFSHTLCPEFVNHYNTEAYAEPGGTPTPLSPPSAFDSNLAVDSSYGNGQWGVYPGYAKELYWGTWWSTNADFIGMCNGTNKMIAFSADAGGDNSFLVWRGTPGSLGEILIFNQTASSNAHVAGWEGDASGLSGWIHGTINQSAAHIAPASGWHRLEVYRKSSSGMNTKDGILRVWVDGLPVINVTDLNGGVGGFSEIGINHTWDGSACLVPPYRDMSKAWHHYWDHMRISVGTCGAACSTPPPSSVTIGQTSQPNGRVGSVYSGNNLTSSGGTAPYTYAVTTGSLPTGITLSSAGVWGGNPTTAGSYTFTVTSTDSTSGTVIKGTASFTIVVDSVANPDSLTATLSWTDVATNETGYEVSYGVNGGEYVGGILIAANSTTYQINIPLPGLFQVCGRVRAYRDNINSARIFGGWSDSSCKLVDFLVPAQPQAFTIQ